MVKVLYNIYLKSQPQLLKLKKKKKEKQIRDVGYGKKNSVYYERNSKFLNPHCKKNTVIWRYVNET